MIIVDTALAERARDGRPVRVGIVGAGFMGGRVAEQIGRVVDGMKVVAVASRDLQDAHDALARAGASEVEEGATTEAIERALGRGRSAATTSPLALARARGVDAILEATGDVECGALVAEAAVAAGTHVVLANADADATVGPLLKTRADRAGVVVTGIDGDEPAVAMNLIRYVRAIGYRPVLAGNLKGFVDPHRTPETQRAFAESVGQGPRMITSFADGTKLALECTLLANASGLGVSRRGMDGYRLAHVDELVGAVDAGALLERGVVDYTLGAAPGSGAFVVGHGETPDGGAFMRYFKMGDGPLYLFYQPYHLPHVEAPLTIARAVLFGDAAVTPLGAPVCEVVATAKRNLTAATELDGIGGFDCYGLIDNAATVRAEGLLPIGLAEGSVLSRDVAMDEPICLADVELDEARVAVRLYREQVAHFGL